MINRLQFLTDLGLQLNDSSLTNHRGFHLVVLTAIVVHLEAFQQILRYGGQRQVGSLYVSPKGILSTLMTDERDERIWRCRRTVAQHRCVFLLLRRERISGLLLSVLKQMVDRLDAA